MVRWDRRRSYGCPRSPIRRTLRSPPSDLMSYILDALRKSEQERARGAAPSLRTAPVTLPAPRKSGMTMLVIVAPLLIAAGVVIGVMRPWHKGEGVPAGRSSSVPERDADKVPDSAARVASAEQAAAPAAAPIPPGGAASPAPAAAAGSGIAS